MVRFVVISPPTRLAARLASLPNRPPPTSLRRNAGTGEVSADTPSTVRAANLAAPTGPPPPPLERPSPVDGDAEVRRCAHIVEETLGENQTAVFAAKWNSVRAVAKTVAITYPTLRGPLCKRGGGYSFWGCVVVAGAGVTAQCCEALITLSPPTRRPPPSLLPLPQVDELEGALLRRGEWVALVFRQRDGLPCWPPSAEGAHFSEALWRREPGRVLRPLLAHSATHCLRRLCTECGCREPLGRTPRPRVWCALTTETHARAVPASPTLRSLIHTPSTPPARGRVQGGRRGVQGAMDRCG